MSAIPFVPVPESRGGMAVPSNLIPTVSEQTGLGQIERTRVAKYRQLQIEALEKGWDPASVISFHPFVVTAQGVKLHEPRIAPVSLDDDFWKKSLKIQITNGPEVPYSQFVIANPEFDILEKPEGGEFDAMASVDSTTYWPIFLAGDIVNQNNSSRARGGVFAYKGAHAPMQSDRRHLESKINAFGLAVTCYCNDCVQKIADQAYADAINFYTSLFTEAEENMGSGDSKAKQRVKPMHRWATRYLRKVGVLKQDPAWLTEILTTVKTAPTFCICGAECLREAIVCLKCNHILKPFEAYQKGVIELDTPGALTALRRCTKEQLTTLALYPEVLPLDEYRAERAKASEADTEEEKGKKGKK